MKLVIMVPAYNEEEFLGKTLASLPRAVEGFDTVEIIVVDDGSSDDTVQVADQAGVEVVRMRSHQGLARTFAKGLRTALSKDADCVINFDADGQYCSEDIPRIVRPVLEGEADMVLGDRKVKSNPHFSPLKRLFQRLGSRIVKLASGVHVSDATTGFRAYSRKAAQRLTVFSSYTYTLETIIQAGIHGIKTTSISVETNPPVRPSRLFTSTPVYVMKAGMTILRIVTLYRPLRIFALFAALFILGGSALFVRFIYFFLMGSGQGHVQSLILGAVLVIVGIQLGLIGLLSDLISINRRLLEELRMRSMEKEYPGNKP